MRQARSEISIALPLLGAVILLVFMAEAAVMLLLPVIAPGVSGWHEALLDSSLLSLISGPMLWFVVVRPVREKMAAEGANEAKSAFLACMSHEIRTPMTAILGSADLLLDRECTPSDRYEHIRVIHRNGEHLLKLINDILDMSRIENGQIEIERIESDLRRILLDVCSMMRVGALEKGLDFGITLETPIPDRILTDPTRLRQILVNLIGNSIKFTHEGGVTMSLAYDEENETPTLTIRIIDTGIGIDEEGLSRLFTPFSQADPSTTRTFGGTGLGLSISRRFARLMGGDITVESEVGRGTVFTVTVPVETAEGSRMISTLEQVETENESRSNGIDDRRVDGRVLLAEDGVDNQRLITLILRKAGAEVEVVENGREAVRHALGAAERGRAFDLILMDMQMPEMDGPTATAVLRRKGYNRPIVALTANATTADRRRCLSAGCDAFLIKPIDRSSLIDTASRFVEKTRGGEAHGAAA